MSAPQGDNVLAMVPALERKITDFNEDAGFCQTGADADGCIVPDEVLVCGTISCLMSIYIVKPFPVGACLSTPGNGRVMTA
jgi:hypothetical protein